MAHIESKNFSSFSSDPQIEYQTKKRHQDESRDPQKYNFINENKIQDINSK